MTTLAGRYELAGEIGQGGMAKVFKAIDKRLGRPVAVKVLAPALAHDQAFVARFQREAQAAARLNHANIVGVFDSGSVGDVHYIVMELVEGRTLTEVLAQDGRILPERATEIAGSVCSALTAAHAAGIVHRDIKPGNIMLTSRGEVKVMDFGIARMDTGQTVAQTAAIMGTASYLSPEQAQGGPVDARSDIYSAGVVLYEMLTGKPPFAGDSAVSVAMQHVQGDPRPPSHAAPGIPPALDSIVMRAMSKNAANRYQTADSFRRDLESARLGQRIAAPVVMPPEPTQILPTAASPEMIEPPSGGRWGLWVLVILILAAFVLGAFLLGRDLLGGAKSSPTPSAGVEKVAVPKLLGMSRSDAQAALNAVDLILGEPTYRQVDTVEIGVIFKQDPRVDVMVEKGTVVDVWIAEIPSDTPSPTPGAGTIPDVRGMTENEAKKALKDAGFDLGEVAVEPSDTVPSGEIISQEPRQGAQFALGTAVDVVVSTGKSTVTVPDLTCMTTAKADQKLIALGLTINIVLPPVPNPLCPQPNRVGSQDTLAGTEVAPGTAVDVHVSGP